MILQLKKNNCEKYFALTLSLHLEYVILLNYYIL